MTWSPPEPIAELQARVSELLMDGERDRADAIMAAACLAQPYGLWVLLRYGLGERTRIANGCSTAVVRSRRPLTGI
jgi:hypothetical protein